MNRADAASLGWLGLLGALAAVPTPAVIAADYLSVEAAQKALFPAADHFTELVLSLDAGQRAQVQDLAGAQPPHRSLRAFRALQGGELLGYVFIDEVIGKQELITYAVGIDAGGSDELPQSPFAHVPEHCVHSGWLQTVTGTTWHTS